MLPDIPQCKAKLQVERIEATVQRRIAEDPDCQLLIGKSTEQSRRGE
jgi:hypothetical protein